MQVLQIIPDGHVSKPLFLKNLGLAYQARYAHKYERSDLLAAGTFFNKAAQCVVGDPDTKFLAARQWARASAVQSWRRESDPGWVMRLHTRILNLISSATFSGVSTANELDNSPLCGYQRALELIPQLVWLGMTIPERYGRLEDIGDIAVEAASWAISVKDYKRALEWLEEGRSVVWNQILLLRTPLDELSAMHVSLGQRLREIALELERGASQPTIFLLSSEDHSSDLEKAAQQHRRLATEWDQLLEQARQIPGFDHFMRPRKADVLVRAARNGPIVVINVFELRCDALIILPNSYNLQCLPLSTFSLEKAINSRAQLMHLIGGREGRAGGFQRKKPLQNQHQLFKQMLATLWLDVVKPILDFLGYTVSTFCFSQT